MAQGEEDAGAAAAASDGGRRRILAERLWALWALVALSLERHSGENGFLPAHVVRVLAFVVIHLLLDLTAQPVMAVSGIAI